MADFETRNDSETQEGLFGINTQDLLFHCAQNPADDYDENLPIINVKKTSPKRPKRKTKKTGEIRHLRSSMRRSSFVLNREACKGRRLIQIKIIDISDDNGESESDIVISAQYIVKDFTDRILDQTERVIKNISENIISDDS